MAKILPEYFALFFADLFKILSTRLKMLFRSKTAIKVRFQKLFNTKYSSKSVSQLFNFNRITLVKTVKTQKFSAIVTKLSND